MDGDDLIEVLLVHREQHAVTDDAGIVDHDVKMAELIHGAVHQFLRRRPVGDRPVVGDCPPACRGDLGRDQVSRAARDLLTVWQLTVWQLSVWQLTVGRLTVRRLTMQPGPGVIDHDGGTMFGQAQGMRAAKPPAPSGHDRYLAVKQAHQATP